MAHPSETVAGALVFVAAAVALVLCMIAFRAQRRTGSRGLTFLVAAFALFALKSVLVGIALLTEIVGHQHLEVVSAAFDLAILGLLIWPIIR